jgi:hypothetical protein
MKTKLLSRNLFIFSLLAFFLAGIAIAKAETCECSLTFGGGNPCTGGVCDGCHCDYSNCKADCTCASSTPVGSTCSNGCGVNCNGTKIGGGTTSNADIKPLPASSYKSIWQFQMTEADGDKRPPVLGYKNVNPPKEDTNTYNSGGVRLVSEQLYNCDNWNYIQFQNVASCQYSGDDMRNFRVYLAPGAHGDIYLSSSQGNGGSIFITRFGEPPQGSYSKSDITKDGKYVFYGEANIENTTGKDLIQVTGDGLQAIFRGGVAENSPGGWLYIRIIPNNADIQLIQYHASADYAKYKAWYDNMSASNSWDASGDPVESASNPNPTTPTLPTGPDCAQKVCVGNSCWNGTDYAPGIKIQDCAIGEAKANPNSVTPKIEWTAEHPVEEIAYINWTSQNAKSMEVQCTGPAPIARAPIQLTSAEWQKTYTKPNVNDPDGYPGWFHIGTSGTAVCIFYPTNIKDNLPGTPFSATIQVTSTPTCGNSIVEEKEECDYTPSSGQISYVPCSDGKTCQDCKCVMPTKANNYVCQIDNPGCEKSTCKDVRCFDGCNYQQGTRDCKGRE